MTFSYEEVILDDEILGAALDRAKSLPVFVGSHRKKQANIVGSIGELVFENFLFRNDIPFEDRRGSTLYDYIVGDGVTLDLKTKDRTVEPRSSYENSVPLYNHEHQRPDFYYFVSLQRNRSEGEESIRRFKKAFIVGGIDIGTLDREGRKWKAGEIDPSNGTKFWTACINVNMKQLYSNKEMLQIFMNGKA